jgi:hypothetical protein
MLRRLVIYILILLSNGALAQWEYGGKTIGYYHGDTDAFGIANVGNGATIIVWNAINGTDFDLFAQYVDSAGYTRWGENGIVFYEDEGFHQGHPAVLADGEGGAFVVWSDGRHYPDDWISLYGQRLDSLGNVLWGLNGRRLTANPRSHKYPKIYNDGNGGFITVYRSSAYDADIGAQRVDGNGNILWDSAGITLVTAPYDQLYPYTCRASDSTFISCWKDRRDFQSFDSDIYMQRFDLNGHRYWGANGHAAVSWVAGQGFGTRGHNIVADGNGGAVVVWVDNRHHTTGNKVLYADRFAPSGLSLWQVNGKKLGDENLFLARECQVFKLEDSFIFDWGGTSNGFIASYLDSAGNFIWSQPVMLDTMPGQSKIQQPFHAFSYITAYRESGEYRVVVNKVDTSGARSWDELAYIDSYMNREKLISDGYEGLIAVWGKSQAPDIKISRVYEDGHVGGDTTTAIYYSQENIMPKSIELYQNYPNPFNARTRISLQLSSLDPVEIGLYDLLGRKVRSIYSGMPRAYDLDFTIDLSSDEYSSGIYFIVAEQGRERRIVKSTLLK